MNNLFGTMQIQVNEKIYLKDPNSSELGKKIVSEGLALIDEIGLESLTFRKLAKRLETTESSIYRYFESKFKLLLYLTSWYWGWLEYQLVFATTNISNPKKRLNVAINVLAKDVTLDETFGEMNLVLLSRIVVSESSKAYLTKEVDDANKVGFYSGYKRVVKRVSDIMLESNSKFAFSHTLTTTIIEGIHHQKYFAQHLPSLTDITTKSDNLAMFYSQMALSVLDK